MDLLEGYDSSSSSSSSSTDATAKQESKKRKIGSVSIQSDRDVPSNHFVRSVEHRRGHWSGHVGINITGRKAQRARSVRRFQRRLEECGYTGTIVEKTTCHLSFSRYFFLQLASLDSFVQRLTERLQNERCTKCYVATESVLVNDEQTRSFWGWRVRPNPTLYKLVAHVDSVLATYQQPPYYDPPIFHVSLASIAGKLPESWSDQDDIESSDDSDEEEPICIDIRQLHCTFGTTKNYVIPLAPP